MDTPVLDAYEPVPEAQDAPPPALLAQLRTRHAALILERAQHQENVRQAQEFLVDAEKRDFGYAVVISEIERWLDQSSTAKP